MKRKLTLGLLVFFVGVLITACGSKKSSAPAANNNDRFEQISPANCGTSCETNDNATFRMVNEQEYARIFGYNLNNNGTFGNVQLPSVWSQDGGFGFDGFRDFFGSVANCGVQSWFAREAVDRGWVDSSSSTCGLANSNGDSFGNSNNNFNNGFNNGNNSGLAGSYNTDIQYNFRNNELFSMSIRINTGRGNGDIREFFPANNSNDPWRELRTRNGEALRLVLDGDRYALESQQALIGYLEK